MRCKALEDDLPPRYVPAVDPGYPSGWVFEENLRVPLGLVFDRDLSHLRQILVTGCPELEVVDLDPLVDHLDQAASG